MYFTYQYEREPIEKENVFNSISEVQKVFGEVIVHLIHQQQQHF